MLVSTQKFEFVGNVHQLFFGGHLKASFSDLTLIATNLKTCFVQLLVEQPNNTNTAKWRSWISAWGS